MFILAGFFSVWREPEQLWPQQNWDTERADSPSVHQRREGSFVGASVAEEHIAQRMLGTRVFARDYWVQLGKTPDLGGGSEAASSGRHSCKALVFD
jgi:hypothetical protein